LLLWEILGGHLSAPETINLLGGHLLYGLLVGAIALFSAAISDSAATAAIITLSFTIGSWVLDFALTGQQGVLGLISRPSLTQTLLDLATRFGYLAVFAGVDIAECGRQYSYDVEESFASSAIDSQGPADNVGSAAKMPLPERVPEYYGIVRDARDMEEAAGCGLIP